jgi:hypothetical protein
VRIETILPSFYLKPSAAEEAYAWDFGDGEIGNYADVVAVDEDLPDFLVQADSANLLQICVGTLGFHQQGLVT